MTSASVIMIYIVLAVIMLVGLRSMSQSSMLLHVYIFRNSRTVWTLIVNLSLPDIREGGRGGGGGVAYPRATSRFRMRGD